MMKKQVLSLGFVVAAITGWCAVNYNFSAVAPTGQTLYYKTKSSSTVQVVAPNKIGRGVYMALYNWDGYTMPTDSLSIPDRVEDYNGNIYNVTSIERSAFSGCTQLTSVTIPQTITGIPTSSFFRCTGLVSVTLPNNIIRIDTGAFYGCSTLTAIVIPPSVRSISRNAFKDCTSLVSCELNEGITTIGTHVFENCESLTAITLPRTLNSLGARVFYGCNNLQSVGYNAENCTIAHDPSTIEEHLFSYTAVTNLTLDDHVKSIPNSIFAGFNITSITITDSVVSNGWDAFRDNRFLESITFGSSVSQMGTCVIRGCRALTDIYMRGVTPPEVSTSSVNFEGIPDSTILHVPCQSVNAYRTSVWGENFANIQCDGTAGIPDNHAEQKISISVVSRDIVIEGAEGCEVRIYDTIGRMIANGRKTHFNVPTSGIFFVQVGNNPSRRIVATM